MMRSIQINGHIFIYYGYKLLLRVDDGKIGRCYVRTKAECRAVNQALEGFTLVLTSPPFLWRKPSHV